MLQLADAAKPADEFVDPALDGRNLDAIGGARLEQGRHGALKLRGGDRQLVAAGGLARTGAGCEVGR